MLKNLDALAEAIRARAEEHRHTPMIGRTHGVHAEPMTFGLKLALWYAEIQRRHRARAARARGACASARSRAPSAPSRTCRRRSRPTSAGASGSQPAPVSSQIIQRDRHAELMTALAITRRLAREVRARDSRPAEDRDRRGRGAVCARARRARRRCPTSATRSAASRSVGLARLLRGNAMAALENVALWHERDISHSSVERVILPDTFIALDHMLRRFTRIVTGMVVYPDRMRENLERSRAASCSRGRCCSSWRSAASRASRPTRGCSETPCGRSRSSADFKALLLADADVMAVLSRPTSRQRVRSRRAAAPRRRDFRTGVCQDGSRPDDGARVSSRSSPRCSIRRATPSPKPCTRWAMAASTTSARASTSS